MKAKSEDAEYIKEDNPYIPTGNYVLYAYRLLYIRE